MGRAVVEGLRINLDHLNNMRGNLDTRAFSLFASVGKAAASTGNRTLILGLSRPTPY